jgi:hypothetical protein
LLDGFSPSELSRVNFLYFGIISAGFREIAFSPSKLSQVNFLSFRIISAGFHEIDFHLQNHLAAQLKYLASYEAQFGLFTEACTEAHFGLCTAAGFSFLLQGPIRVVPGAAVEHVRQGAMHTQARAQASLLESKNCIRLHQPDNLHGRI